MILIDITTSHMFRHMNPVGILRVEHEVIRTFRDLVAPRYGEEGVAPRQGEEVVFGIYLEHVDRFHRVTADDLALLLREADWTPPETRPRAAPEPRLWPSRKRKLAYLRALLATFRASRSAAARAGASEDPLDRMRRGARTRQRLAEDLLRLSAEEYAALRRWLARAGRVVPRIAAHLATLDEINNQIETGCFDWGEADRADQGIVAPTTGSLIDPATVTHYVSAGAFWSDARHRHAHAGHADHGWCVHYLIYDLIPVLWRHVTEPTTKETFPEALHWVLWGVDQIWTISQTTKDDLVAHIDEYGYPPLADDRITPVYLGADIATRDPTPEDDAATLARYRLEPGGFVLMVGTLEPRKNHDFAYRLWRELNRRHPGTVLPLVWVGQPGWSIGPLLGQVSEDLGLPHRNIQSLTVVSDAELSVLYRACRFTIFPAHYEGWGLPLVESLNYGRPCIASDAPSLIEAGRGAAEHIGLFEGERWLARLHALMIDEAAYAEALAHAGRFERWRWRDFRTNLAASFADLAAPTGRQMPADDTGPDTNTDTGKGRAVAS